MNTPLPTKAVKVRVYGLVQGVGFRPFLFRVAESRKLNGWVLNRNDCVEIHLEGSDANIKLFMEELENRPPPLSSIDRVETGTVEAEGLTGFTIRKSESSTDDVTRISPDMAVCADCLMDIKHQDNRIDYPFVNCTNCGPRFTIVVDLPYDRPRTTMADFIMCESCRREYEDLRDRRFHAQPNACLRCGPAYELIEGENRISDLSKILDRFADHLESGHIVAVKGIGGFHLACDASNQSAVEQLRKEKTREAKPFALMCRDIEIARSLAKVSVKEEKLLLSQRRPIVLLEKIGGNTSGFAPAVADGLDAIGLMLPYTPIHHLLFEKLKADTLVLTSGNISDEPISIENEEATKRLAKAADAFLIYNRRIHNRSDDSVTMVVNEVPRIVRRSRGFVPEPTPLAFEAEGIIAVGAELKSCFCIGKGKTAILSQHIGDLKNQETYEFYAEAMERFRRLFRLSPRLLGCDLHPDYLSTRYAEKLGLPLVRVQHHHAHIASCMAEHRFEGRVIGVALDGTGLGDDGAIWGGEFLLADLSGYRRSGCFAYVPMPGGDRAAEEPWRMALAYLHHTYGADFEGINLPVLKELRRDDLRFLVSAIEAGINTPLTSSAGRLFDAVAGITGLVLKSRYEAEAAMRLQSTIAATDRTYPFETQWMFCICTDAWR